MKEPREPKAPDGFLSWAYAFEKKNDERGERQEAFNAKQEKFNAEVIKRLDNLEKDVAAIKECPTIKKELKNK